MLFPTTVFAVFFFIVYQLHWGLTSQPRLRKWMLLAASLFFYGFWSWKFALMLLGSALVNHAAACRMQYLHEHAEEKHRRRLLTLIVGANLLLLGVFKYTGFLVFDTAFPILGWVCERLGGGAMDWFYTLVDTISPAISTIVLPVGISFFTFQALSYVVDVYRNQTPPAKSWIDFTNYLAFFPQLVAGPIVRAKDLVPQMEAMPPRTIPIETGRAMFLILVGLFKKTVIANWLAGNLADPVFANPAGFSGPDILIGIYGYALQIYCDFSAYSDIAIGCALLLGYHFPINFNAPYFATTLQDFWRRWHISLSSWLRDYLYIPLGGSRRGNTRTYINLFLTFLLGGMWHGAAWTFIWWGAFHGAYLSIERKVRDLLKIPPKGAAPAHPLVALLGRIWIIHVVCLSWILFRSGNMETVTGILTGITSWTGGDVGAVTLWTGLTITMLVIAFMTQFCDGFRLVKLWDRIQTMPAWAQGAIAACIFTIILALGPTGVAPFIYFQF